MAMSLEDLLAEEGFKGRKSKTAPRASSGPLTTRIPMYPTRDERQSVSSSRLKKTERAYSDMHRYNFKAESPATGRDKGRRSHNNATKREKFESATKNETREKLDRRGSELSSRNVNMSIGSSGHFSSDEIVEMNSDIQRVKAGEQDNEVYQGTYQNGAYSPSLIAGRHSNATGEWKKYENSSGEDIQVTKKYGNSSNKHRHEGNSYNGDYQKRVKECGSSSNRLNKSAQNNNNFDENRSHRRVEIEQVATELALDEAAIKAIISILSGHIKRFLKDPDFRISLHHTCFAALNFSEIEEGLIAESKVIANLDQAIETVERAAEECATTKELKKAALQLSVITGLNSNDLKDGFTSGIPNSMLSACGHLYLSVIYQLQKKDRIAAKHLLQVFCDCPLQARTMLVPELWDYIFHPHLLHLEAWYDEEVKSIADTPARVRMLKQLKKVYDETLDSATYQFAVYYKNWLTEGVEAPAIPSIIAPPISVQRIQHGVSNSHSVASGSPGNPFSPQPMVSKKLYDSVFGRTLNSGAMEVEEYKGAEKLDDGSVVEDKTTLTYYSEAVPYKDLDVEQEGAFDQVLLLKQGGLTAEEAQKLSGANNIGERYDIRRNPLACQEDSKSINILDALSISEVNELTLKRLAASVFEFQQTEKSVDFIDSTLLPQFNGASYPDSLPTEIRPWVEDLHEKDKYVEPGHSLYNIPQDYICSLTGHIFEDPVTLETGQTYERAAITDWFTENGKTCPVTGKSLECQAVPLTNFILKRIIGGWKSEHSRNILSSVSRLVGTPGEQKYKDEAAVFILEQLLTIFGPDETLKNAKQLVAFGGLQFLFRRFKYGNLNEKTCVAALLSCCIEADSGCRSHIARNIEKHSLFDLLHCSQVQSRTNAAILLFELICLNRRKDAHFLFRGFQGEMIISSMQVLLALLQQCRPEQRPLVAVLLLHLDLMVDSQKYSVYREEAVDAITTALSCSLFNQKVREMCCRALLVLGGRISFSGKVMTEDWILKKAGFLDGPESEIIRDQKGFGESIPLDDKEEEATQDWLIKLSACLLIDGRKSFLVVLSQCLASGHKDLRRVCLTTVAWLSSTLALLPESELQLSSFSVIISQLKENLVNGECVEHKVLASMSLHNFSKLSECRALLMTIAKDISTTLQSLSESSWTAKELYAMIPQEDL